MRQSILLRCMCPEAVDDHGGWYEEPVNEKLVSTVSMGMFQTDLIKIDFDTTNIGCTDRNHPEESKFPSTEECHTFIQNKKILQSFCHVG